MSKKQIPSYDAFMNPILDALHALGGSGTIEEINNKVIEAFQFSDELLELVQNPERGSQTVVEYRLAWARTYLKKYGLIENSARGVWSLTAEGRKTPQINAKKAQVFVRKQFRQPATPLEEPDVSEVGEQLTWREELMATLLNMEPSAFERLVQRLLRESGFIQVEVTGRSGDGGVDGKGIMRLAGLLSFHVIFQCKRYKGAVSASQVRDFRGAMVGRADKGLLITTGNFTKDAMREATRDGAPAIDLIDGEQLVDRLKELTLGVQIKKVEIEQVIVEQNWFASI